jgi:hypothetical protein
MKNLILVVVNCFFLISFDSQAASVAAERGGEGQMDPAKLVSRLSVASVASTSSNESEDELTLKQKVLAILDGNLSEEQMKRMNVREVLSAKEILDYLGNDQMAEFFRILGDFLMKQQSYDDAGICYYQALHMPEGGNHHLSIFLAEYGVTTLDDSGKISEKLKAYFSV